MTALEMNLETNKFGTQGPTFEPSSSHVEPSGINKPEFSFRILSSVGRFSPNGQTNDQEGWEVGTTSPIQHSAVQLHHNCTIWSLVAKNIPKCWLSWPLALAAYFVTGILLFSQKQQFILNTRTIIF